MDRGFCGFRRAGWGAVCALALTCVWVPAGHAGQTDGPADSAAKKPATSKTAAGKDQKPASTAATVSGSTKSASSTHRASTHLASTKSRSRKKKSLGARGQQKIDSDRARSIQEALIREHYMSGQATGTWNQASEDAMRKYQADQGWQSKTVPDSRALIKLGLGPSNDHLLNPESAMITGPFPSRSESAAPTSHTSSPTSDPAPVATPNQNGSSSPQ